MKSKTRMGNILLAAGALFLAAALLLTGSNLFETYQAGQASERLSQEVRSRIESQAQEADSLSQAALAGGEEETPEYLRNPEMEMPVEEIEGNGYIGLLEIPALGLVPAGDERMELSKPEAGPLPLQRLGLHGEFHHRRPQLQHPLWPHRGTERRGFHHVSLICRGTVFPMRSRWWKRWRPPRWRTWSARSGT